VADKLENAVRTADALAETLSVLRASHARFSMQKAALTQSPTECSPTGMLLGELSKQALSLRKQFETLLSKADRLATLVSLCNLCFCLGTKLSCTVLALFAASDPGIQWYTQRIGGTESYIRKARGCHDKGRTSSRYTRCSFPSSKSCRKLRSSEQVGQAVEVRSYTIHFASNGHACGSPLIHSFVGKG
jgi:hypothetical protein